MWESNGHEDNVALTLDFVLGMEESYMKSDGERYILGYIPVRYDWVVITGRVI